MYICEASKILATSARTTPTKTSPNFHTMATFYKAISTRATSKCNARLKDTRVYVCVWESVLSRMRSTAEGQHAVVAKKNYIQYVYNMGSTRRARTAAAAAAIESFHIAVDSGKCCARRSPPADLQRPPHPPSSTPNHPETGAYAAGAEF